ncbi:TIGR03862 family flavoprotein [Aquabacterium sp.]|uniref:NAD(P)/FAD-dependent oxidoreductase n=1 Tax=Aquabacterium sp. TaxID=1872578 RepID=UPI0025C5DC14|nr:TIGR03862 family flavoprotein [Aquabacterium sp.]
MTDSLQNKTPACASTKPCVAIVGGGPAGLMAAEVLSQQGVSVDLFDAMPSVGRKFLLAGRGGLNLTHSEPLATFMTRFGSRQAELAPLIEQFTPDDLRAWAQGLGIETFVGTSGRVFPTDMKAAPLLRAWLHRLRQAGVRFHMRHRWLGWTDAGQLRFSAPHGEVCHQAHATVLALGGASWARLGSDGAWVPWLLDAGASVAPLRPANCGFDVLPTGPDRAGWSDHLRQRFAGQPIKPVALALPGEDGQLIRQQGEFVLTDTGLEGSLIYAFSARIRDEIDRSGQAIVYLDLLPSHTLAQVQAETARPRGPRSLSTHLKSRLGIQGIKMALLHECLTPAELNDAQALAGKLKALPITLARPRPVDEAISTAGGVTFESLDAKGMLKARPGLFCCGEMLDWEAPTGGYLLTASMASGKAAALGVRAYLANSVAT